MSDVTVEQIELSMEKAKEVIALSDAMERLVKTADFDKLIHEYYFKEEASRLVMLKAHPALQSEEKQKDLIRSMDAIGSFRQFLIGVRKQGDEARRAIEEGTQELELMRVEALSEEV